MKQKLLNSFRLKATLLVAVLCALFTGTAWAQTTVTTTSFSAVSGNVGNDTNVTYAAYKGGGTSNPAVNSNAIRLYQNTSGATAGYVVIGVAEGYSITSATIQSTLATTTGYKLTDTDPESSTPEKSTFNVSNYSLSANTDYTVSNISTRYITFACFGTSAGSRLYLSKISITYTSGSGSSAVATTTSIDAEGITNTDVYTSTAAGSLSATVTPDGGSALVSPTIEWSSSDESVATIAANGKVTLVAAGTTTITASYAGVTDSYQASSATYELTVTDSTPIPTHTATFSVNGATSTQDFEEGASIEFPDDPADVNGKTFVGWVTGTIDGTTDDAPDFVTSANMGNSDITYYAVFAIASGGSSTIVDELNSTWTGISTNNYSTWSDKDAPTSTAVYAGNCAGDNSTIQLRSNNSNSGIVTTTSGGKVKKVVISWYDDTANGRTVNVYGKNSEYSAATDLYNNSSQGTLLGTIVKGTSTELNIDGDYEYIGFRSNSGALYMDEVNITWSTGSGVSYSDYCTTVAAAVPVSSVSVDATASVNVGETTTLTATISPDNATNKNVTWESDDETVAIVDASGVVTGVAAGTATITVTSVADNTKTATCTVTVTTVAVTSVSVDATASVNVGETTTLTATVLPNNATNKNVTWESDDETIATVDANGVVTGVAAGTATITVTSAADNTKTATCTVTVSLVPGTEARPYTVAEALTAINALANNGTIDDKYVAGKISQVDSYNNGAITYWISDDGTTTSQLQVYKGKGLSDANFSAVTDLEVGDAVVVYGQLKKYVSSNSTTPEFNTGSQLVSRTEKPASDLAKTSDIVLDYLNNNTTADVTDYISSSSTGAYTFTVGDGTIIENADEIISALAVGTTTVTVNQAATLSYKAGSVVINVTVQDTRTAASTIPGINISTLAEGAADGTIEVVNPVKADEGATFSFTSSDEDVLLIIDDAYTVGEVGTATVTVTATPNNTSLYKPVVANFNVTVQAASMEENEITLAAYSGSTVYGTPLNVNYTVADGYDGTMGYSIANSAIADVAIGASAITFTPKAVGSTTVTISAPATGNFYAADDVTYTLTVTAPAGKTTAFEAGTVVLDFRDNSDWGFPEGSANKKVDEGSFTSDGYTITLAGSSGNGYYFNTSGYLLMGKSGAILTLPAFDKAVTQIDVVGTSTASETVTQNIFVGGTAVSTETTGAKNKTNEYVIASDYQAAGNIYSLKVTSAANTQITSITVHFKGITAKLNASGYASFCSEYPLDFSKATGYSAWQITAANSSTGVITFSQVTGSVKGGTGLLLKGTDSETITLTSANSTNTLDDNLLYGTTAPTYVVGSNDDGYNYYGLSGDQFKKVNTGVVPAGKALLPASEISSLVKAFTFVFEGADGITETREVSREEVESIFNLGGQRMSKLQRGINIVNGRKVLVK